MSVKLENTFYYLMAQNHDGAVPDDQKPLNYAKKHLQFQYLDITYENYANIAKVQGKELGTDVFSKAKEILYTIIETISHLAKAIFGVLIAISDGGDYLKLHIYYLGRDLQEIYGRISAHFSNIYGQFHVQEALFHKKCYENYVSGFLAEIKSSLSGPEILYCSSSDLGGVMTNSTARKTTLYNYKQQNEEERKATLEKCELRNLKLGGTEINLNEFIEKCDPEILKLITFRDLIIPVQHSKLKYALMDAETFNVLTIEKIKHKDFNHEQGEFIARRSKLLHDNALNFEPNFDFNNYKTILFKDLLYLKSEQIASRFREIPQQFFYYFLDSQLQGLKLANLDEDKNKSLFKYLNEDETRARLALFENQDVLDAVKADVLNAQYLTYLPVDFLNTALLDLDVKFINRMSSSIFNQRERDQKLFSSLDTDVVKQLLLQDKLGWYHFGLLSQEKRIAIKLENLPEAIIKKLFSNTHKEENLKIDRELFADFEVSDVKLAVEQGKLTTQYQLRLLSQKQRQAIKLSVLPKKIINTWYSKNIHEKDDLADKICFADFDPQDIKLAYEKKLLSDYHKTLMSDLQKKAVETSTVKNEKDSSSQDLKTFKTAEEAKEAFERGEVQIQDIPLEFLRSYDFSTWSAVALIRLQYPTSIDELRSLNSFTERRTIVNGVAVENPTEVKCCKFTEDQLKEIAKNNQVRNDKILSLFSQKQRDDINAKLATI